MLCHGSGPVYYRREVSLCLMGWYEILLDRVEKGSERRSLLLDEDPPRSSGSE